GSLERFSCFPFPYFLLVYFCPFVFICRTDRVSNDAFHFRIDEHSNEFLVDGSNDCIIECYLFSLSKIFIAFDFFSWFGELTLSFFKELVILLVRVSHL